MVDGKGGVRPHWRNLLSVLTGLGPATLLERTQRLEHVALEEGVSRLLPGAPPDRWQFDPVPALLPETEFAGLEAGLIQRARIFDAMLCDLYGPQLLLRQGVLPPALVYGNPGFLRPCCGQLGPGLLQFYAADLLRGPDGAWRVLADRTGRPEGVGHAFENRRRLGRVMPELFAAQLLQPLGPFADLWQDALQGLSSEAGNDPGGVALLTPGHGSAEWFGHLLAARELSCALVECDDLTVRDGRLFLKTLRGLQPISVLLRGEAGNRIDPLEMEPGAYGVPGLIAASRNRAVRIVNDPGTGLAEAPGLAAFLPALGRYLLGEELALPGIETFWLDDAQARRAVLQHPAAWLVRPALEVAGQPIAFVSLQKQEQQDLLAHIAAEPWKYVARSPVSPSVAPCLDAGQLVPRPLVVRLFLMQTDGTWHVMPGGLGCALPEGASAWPVAGPGLAKDVWILSQDPLAVSGPPVHQAPVLEIRRVSGDLPSRVADNFFWLGRYLERLEGIASLLRAAMARLARPSLAPHEIAELEVLIACLAQAGVVNAETISGVGAPGLIEPLLRAASPWGAVHAMIGQVSRLTGLMRDRLTAEMYSVMTRGLSELEDGLRQVRPQRHGQSFEAAEAALFRVLVFAATVSGLAAENMVRGGGRLFLDLGRRVERAQAIADELASALDLPDVVAQTALIENRLRLVLELRDSVIAYRRRYASVLQPALALDLVLADESNPRGLAFQLVDAAVLLSEIDGTAESALADTAITLRQACEAMVRSVAEAPEQAPAAAHLAPRLRLLRDAVAEMSDLISRRYFALLPTVRSVGLNVADVPDAA